jgi:chromosome segregation ATPase
MSALKDKICGIVSISGPQIQAELDTAQAQASSFDYIQMAEDIVKKVQLALASQAEIDLTRLAQVPALEAKVAAEELTVFTLKNEGLRDQLAVVTEELTVFTLENEGLRAQLLVVTRENEGFREQLSAVTRENESLGEQVAEQRLELTSITAEVEWQRAEKDRIQRLLFQEQRNHQRSQVEDWFDFDAP